MGLIGARIGNIYVEALVGSGGMGEVYRGLDEKLERRVAIKTLHHKRRLSTEARARFLREAKLLSRLDHPGICRVHDLVEGDDTDHLILEYVDGRTLFAARERMPDLQAQLRIMEQVAEALVVAHDQGIVHRDLKPENVMVTQQGRAKVLDFGIARMTGGLERDEPEGPREEPPIPGSARGDNRITIALSGEGTPPTEEDPDLTRGMEHSPSVSDNLEDRLSVLTADELASMTSFTRDGMVVGTPHYMSPEQAVGEPVGAASDVYSLGIVLQELVTREHAYHGERRGKDELLPMVIRGQTRPVEGVDADVTRLIGEMTALQPEQRPSAVQVVSRLRWILERPVRARRRRGIALGIAAVLLLVLGAVFLTARLSRPDPLLAPDQEGRIALIPFENSTGDEGLDWVEHGLMEMLAQSLHETDGIEVVPPARLGKAMERLELESGAALTCDQAAELAGAVSAELVIGTTVSRDGDGYAFTYTSRNVNGSESANRVVVDELTDGVSELGQRLVLRLEPDATWVEIEDRFSDDPLANQSYAMGLQRLTTEGARPAAHYFHVCLDRDPEFAMAALQLAATERLLGEMDDARERATSIAEQARAGGDERLELHATLELAANAQYRGDPESSIELAEHALTLAEARDDREATMRALKSRGVSSIHVYRYAEADEILARYQDMAEEIGDERRSGEARLYRSSAAHRSGDLDAAEAHIGDAMARFEAIGDRNRIGQCHHQLGRVAWGRDDFSAALQHFEQALAVFRETGWLIMEGAMLMEVAAMQIQQQRYNEAERNLLQALEVHGSGGSAREATRCKINLAEMRIRQGRLDEADQLLVEAGESPCEDLWACVVTCRLHYARGHYDQAVELAGQLKQKAGDGWTPDNEEEAGVYRRAAREGRRHPLPHEPDYVAVAQSP